MPNITMVWAIWAAPKPAMYLRIWNQMDTSSRPRPTTVKPMTAPEEKATLRPRFRLSWAALAVRALAEVAIFMPTKPARPDQMPPVRKAKGINQLSSMSSHAKINKITKTIIKIFATVVYWRLRYALAPFRIDEASFCISSVPSENFNTFFACVKAKISAIRAPANPSQNKFSIDLPHSFVLENPCTARLFRYKRQ